uniref:Uncharacterized protein n=1 Tax=Leersia perrieri TaxID=77586 RepID=A0A0D9VKU5_9ORYZ
MFFFPFCSKHLSHRGIENARSSRSIIGTTEASHELTARLRRQRQPLLNLPVGLECGKSMPYGSCSGDLPGRYWLFPTSTVESPNTYTAGTRCTSSLSPVAAAEICTQPAMRTNATSITITLCLIMAPAASYVPG